MLQLLEHDLTMVITEVIAQCVEPRLQQLLATLEGLLHRCEHRRKGRCYDRCRCWCLGAHRGGRWLQGTNMRQVPLILILKIPLSGGCCYRARTRLSGLLGGVVIL